MFDKIIKSVTDFVPNLIWLVVTILVGHTIWILHHGLPFVIDSYLQGIVVAVGAGITTALWVGAIDQGSD